MLTLWCSIVATAVASLTIKGLGPILLGGHDLPPRARGVVALLAPVLLLSLVVADLLGQGWAHVDRALAVGVGAAATARWAGLPDLVAVAAGVVVTATVRALL